MTAVLTAERVPAGRAGVEAKLAGVLMPREIVTERLILRPFDRSDWDGFAALFGDPVATRFIGGPTDAAGALERMERFSGGWRLYGGGPYTVLSRDGAFLGYAGLWFPNDWPEVEIGYGLLPAAQGKGFAREAVRAIRAEAEAAGVPSLVSYIAPENTASQRVASAAGAVREGTHLFSTGESAEVWRYASRPAAPCGEDVVIDARKMPLRIATKRLQLAPWRPDHFDAVHALFSDEETMHFIGGVQSLYRSSRIFSTYAGAWHLSGYGMYAVEHEGAFCGMIGLYKPGDWPDMEIAYTLAKAARGKGFATEAVAAVRNVAHAQGMARLVSYVHPDNHRSAAVARRVGATIEGRITIHCGPVDVFVHKAPAP
ncbi:MAG: GNAT family N-acetyltransferase [Pseudomonadota bacterium]